MSLNKANEKCAVCKAYLFPEDDVVYCPECGAPHHRDCYNSIGHCALEEFHGTEQQYQKPEVQSDNNIENETQSDGDYMVTCRMCGEKYSNDQPMCPNCGTPDMSKMGGHFVAFDLLGGIPADTDLGDGVTADEAKMFVGSNTHRYIPKFVGFKHGKKTSWNWLAFLTPSGWLASRKMYWLALIIAALEIALAMLAVPFAAEINQLDFSTVNGFFEQYNLIMDNLNIVSKTALITAFVGSSASIILRIIMGIFGDLIYRNRVIAKVSEIKSESEDKTLDYRKKGGVSIIWGIVTFYLVRELPAIVAQLMGML